MEPAEFPYCQKNEAGGPDRIVGEEAWREGMGAHAGVTFGALFNPRGYPWTEEQAGNVDWGQHKKRLEGLAENWYGKAFVGDGADAVLREAKISPHLFANAG